MAVFDVVANNADRKGGHVLAAHDGRLLGVDHGVMLPRRATSCAPCCGAGPASRFDEDLAVLDGLERCLDDPA